jgi:hypothetical protein
LLPAGATAGEIEGTTMMRRDNAGLRRSRQASRLLWELDKDVIWHEPEPRSNGRYRAYFEATEEQAKAITAAGNDYLNSGEGFFVSVRSR